MQGLKRRWHSIYHYHPRALEETHGNPLASMIEGVTTRCHVAQVKFAWCVHNTHLIMARFFDTGCFGKTTTNGYAHHLKQQEQSSSFSIHRAEGENTGELSLDNHWGFCLPQGIEATGLHVPDTANLHMITGVFYPKFSRVSHELPRPLLICIDWCSAMGGQSNRPIPEDGTSFIQMIWHSILMTIWRLGTRQSVLPRITSVLKDNT